MAIHAEAHKFKEPIEGLPGEYAFDIVCKCGWRTDWDAEIGAVLSFYRHLREFAVKR